VSATIAASCASLTRAAWLRNNPKISSRSIRPTKPVLSRGESPDRTSRQSTLALIKKTAGRCLVADVAQTADPQ
jgi:hypothetical protein